jgi:hypothetical protein
MPKASPDRVELDHVGVHQQPRQRQLAAEPRVALDVERGCLKTFTATWSWSWRSSARNTTDMPPAPMRSWSLVAASDRSRPTWKGVCSCWSSASILGAGRVAARAVQRGQFGQIGQTAAPRCTGRSSWPSAPWCPGSRGGHALQRLDRVLAEALALVELRERQGTRRSPREPRGRPSRMRRPGSRSRARAARARARGRTAPQAGVAIARMASAARAAGSRSSARGSPAILRRRAGLVRSGRRPRRPRRAPAASPWASRSCPKRRASSVFNVPAGNSAIWRFRSSG